MKKLVIVNADDFGLSDEVDDGILFSFINGYISQTTLIVNGPCAEKAVIKAIDAGFGNAIGLHLNLSYGLPLTLPIRKCKRFCGNDGKFIKFNQKRLPQVFLSKKKNVLFA